MSRRVLWFDGSQGASGDMILGALVDLGVPAAALREGLRGLPLPTWRLEVRRLQRCGLAACKVDVEVPAGAANGQTLADLERILDAGALAPRVRRRAGTIFRRLVEAEAAVHGRPIEEVHLHEVGATDAVVDIVGACLGLEHLAVGRIVVSELTTGHGEVRCAHGVYPVPAPATALLMRGTPVRGGAIAGERLTPTGAAILTTLADEWGPLPSMVPDAVGYGAGERDLGDVPNLLRAVLGRSAAPTAEGDVVVAECTIDDATPQALAWAAERLRAAGALEVHLEAILMKKGRPGHRLTLLGRPTDIERLAREVFRTTPTLGLRYRVERRYELEREQQSVTTPWGEVRLKLGRMSGEVVQVWPEYEDCVTVAERAGVSLVEVQRAALSAWNERAPG